MIVTEQELAPGGTASVTECHAFFCGALESYALFTVTVKEEDKSYIDNEEIRAAAKQRGEFHLNEYLADKSNVRYQAILAGFGGKFAPSKSNLLKQLHLRNFLFLDVESKIENNTNNGELKNHIQMVSKLPRVTTEKKI